MQRKAFTLIELMVVVAVIAILATLAISNFSAAIRRARNAGRQSDILAVAKGMETCYDVPSGKYTGITADETNPTMVSASGPFKAGVGNNLCINGDIEPEVENYPYSYIVDADAPQKFVVCAELEPVPNWDSVGNTSVPPAGDLTYDGSAFEIKTDQSCDPAGDASTQCFFCVTNQQ